MTEKRFILYEHKDNDYILDNPNVHLDFIEMLGDALTSEEIVDLLNQLNDENEQLKKQNDWLKSIHFANDVLKENKELKQTVHRLKENITELLSVDIEEELLKENEQLKQSYKEFEDECQSTFNAMSRKQDDLYRKNFKLKEENEQLKSFIKSLASPDGRIWLSSGYGYRIDKILNDFNNTENDDGDLE